MLSWLASTGEKRHALRFSELHGETWTEAREVVAGDDLVANWADLPGVAPVSGGRLVAWWLSHAGDQAAGWSVRISTSSDGGLTWSAPVSPHRDATPAAEHGFVSVFESREGATGIAWLDGRASAQPGGATALMATTLGAAGLGPEVVLDPRACDCCPTAVARAGGAAIVAYRDRSDDEVRDIATVRRPSAGGWALPVVPHRDGWTLAGCPVNGPAIDARGDDAVLAWYSEAEGHGRVLVARSGDAGATWEPASKVDDGTPSGQVVAILLDDRTAVVGWVGRQGPETAFLLRRIWTRTGGEAAVRVATLGPGAAAGRPQLVRAGSRRLVLAWTREEAGVSHVLTATIGLTYGRL